jgi:hypothetical protein
MSMRQWPSMALPTSSVASSWPQGCPAAIVFQISRDAWLDESYVSRLFSGERSNPSRDALVLLGAWGLELAVEEVDELLMAAD